MPSFMICAYFPLPAANTKFNPVMKMYALLIELIKTEPSVVVVVVVNPISNLQIVLSANQIPTNKEEFKKFFTISADMCAATSKQHIITRCQLLSERTLKEIKFNKTKPQFMEWLDKEKVFIESDSLSILKTMTIGYITKLHLQLTN